METGEIRQGKAWMWFLAAALCGAAILVVAFAAHKSAPAPVPAPPPKRPPRLARISDEGSLTRQSPEKEFLSVTSKTAPVNPRPVDLKDTEKESRRILGGLREIFVKMRNLAAAYKKSDPARYAAEMEALKEELARLMQASNALLKDSDDAVQELFQMIREEEDAVVKEHLAFLLRFVSPERAGPFAVKLSESSVPADRSAAIDVLQDLRTQDATNALMRLADADPQMDLRQRAIVGLGKTLAGPSPDYGQYQASVLDTLRRYTQPGNEAPIRTAAWYAFSYPPDLSPEDKKLIRDSLHAEKDPAVLKSVEDAFRHLNAREKAEADRLNPKNKAVPR